MNQNNCNFLFESKNNYWLKWSIIKIKVVFISNFWDLIFNAIQLMSLMQIKFILIIIFCQFKIV